MGIHHFGGNNWSSTGNFSQLYMLASAQEGEEDPVRSGMSSTTLDTWVPSPSISDVPIPTREKCLPS